MANLQVSEFTIPQLDWPQVGLSANCLAAGSTRQKSICHMWKVDWLVVGLGLGLVFDDDDESAC